MASSNSHPIHIPPPKCANPPGEEAWAYAVLSSQQRCLAAPALAALLLRSRTSPGLQFTCGQSQRCPMLCCCLACNELVVSVLFPRDGSQYSRKKKTAAGTAAGRLSRGNALSLCLPACLPACLREAWQGCLHAIT